MPYCRLIDAVVKQKIADKNENVSRPESEDSSQVRYCNQIQMILQQYKPSTNLSKVFLQHFYSIHSKLCIA